MARRTRTRLNKPKKASTTPRKQSKFDVDQDPPSEATWATMTPYGSFIVEDADGKEHLFSKEDLAIVVPAGRDPQMNLELWKYWVGKIKDIRAIIHDENSNSVWARVQWYYSGKDVSDVIKSFDRNVIGQYERVFSDHFDFVGPEAFNGVINVAEFSEDDPEQDYIPPKTFYSRYAFEYKACRLQPKPGSSTCVCSAPYVPEDTAQSKLMHFCPRPSCRIAYHEKCLLNIKSQDTDQIASPSSSPIFTQSARKHASAIHVKRKAVNGHTVVTPTKTTQSRVLRLLACSPDTDDDIDLESLIPMTVVQENAQSDSDTETAQPPKKKRRGRPSKKMPSSRTEAVIQSFTLAEVLSTIPPDLLKAAQQPLVRGGAFELGGVAGNIGIVTRARRFVYRALEGREVPSDWEELLFGEDSDVTISNAIVKLRGGKMVPPLLCPKCNSAI